MFGLDVCLEIVALVEFLSAVITAACLRETTKKKKKSNTCMAFHSSGCVCVAWDWIDCWKSSRTRRTWAEACVSYSVRAIGLPSESSFRNSCSCKSARTRGPVLHVRRAIRLWETFSCTFCSCRETCQTLWRELWHVACLARVKNKDSQSLYLFK